MSETVVDVVGSVPDGSDALAGCFTARDYHGGQWSQLYALSSSGKVRNLFYLGVELREAVGIAEDQGEYEDAENLRALLLWVDAQPVEDGES